MVEEKSEAYIRAVKRVEAKLGFYRHFAVYIGVNSLLFLINVFSSPGEWWFYWPLLGWGIGVFFHFMNVFVTGGLITVNKWGVNSPTMVGLESETRVIDSRKSEGLIW
jgi:hypothetical protein